MRQRGFSLIELLVVIAIIGILSVVSFSSFVRSLERGRDSQRKSDLGIIRKGLESYINDFGVYPESNATGKILGCNQNDPTLDKTCLQKLEYYLNGALVTALNKLPSDPNSDRKYFYVRNADNISYSLYAALETTTDKDVWTGQATLPSCGSVTCNYKVTSVGLETN